MAEKKDENAEKTALDRAEAEIRAMWGTPIAEEAYQHMQRALAHLADARRERLCATTGARCLGSCPCAEHARVAATAQARDAALEEAARVADTAATECNAWLANASVLGHGLTAQAYTERLQASESIAAAIRALRAAKEGT